MLHLLRTYRKELFSQVYLPFLFSLFFFVSSIALNASFRLMGVDLSEELGSILNKDYAGYFILTSAKVFLIYFLILHFLLFPFKLRFQKTNKSTFFLSFFYLSILLGLGFLGSVCMYPQLYGDFFYLQHPYLLSFLYFITNYFSPHLYYSLFVFVYGSSFLFLFYSAFKKGEEQILSYVVYLSLFLLLYIYSSLIPLVVLFLLFPLYKMFQLSNKKQVAVLFLIFISFLSFYYYDNRSTETKITALNKAPLIWIVADSLRADRISFLYKGKSITPNLDRFKKESLSFEDHHVTIARTFPSWADMLSGEYSMSHKIRHMFPSKEEKNNLGSGFFPTLPQILKEHGFHTAVFSNFAGDIFPRANFGFDKTEAPNFSALVILVQKVLEPQVFLMPFLTGEFLGGGKFFKEVDGLPGLGDGRRILPEIRKYIRKNKNSPFFLTTFFSVTHFPYSPPYPYYKQFGDPNYRGQYKFFKFVDPSKSTKPSKKDMEQIRNVFNAAVHTFDQEFGELIRYLKEEGIYDSSFILVTGDHGEALYEGVHGQGHGEHLRGENISRVPLFIKYPSSYTGLKKGQIEEMSSSIDLLPTILDYYKIPTHKNFPGLSLNRLPNQKSKFTDRKVYTETGIWFSDKGEHFFQKERIMYPNILKLHTIIPSEGFQIMITKPEYKDKIAFAKHRGLIGKQYKLIYIPTSDGVHFELFDRLKDPLNTQNLWNSLPVVGKAYKDELFELCKKAENAEIINDYIFIPPITK